MPVKIRKYTVVDILQLLLAIAQKPGTQQKIEMMYAEISHMSEMQAKILLQILMGNLDIKVQHDALYRYVADALIQMGNETKRQILIQNIQQSCNLRPDYMHVFDYIQKHIQRTISLNPKIHCPMMPMKIQKINKIQRPDDNTIIEAKYDGFRCHIHYSTKKLQIFSRNLIDITDQFQVLVEHIRDFCIQQPACKRAIFDCEIVPYDYSKQQPLPFYYTKTNKNNLCVFVFDILCYNNQYLQQFELRQRQSILNTLVWTNEVRQARQYNHTNNIQQLVQQATSCGYEGIIIKKLNSKYFAGLKTSNWTAIKGVSDSLDLIIIGADYGRGKRGGLYGSFLVATRVNSRSSEFKAISKVGIGFANADLVQLTDKLGTGSQGKLAHIDYGTFRCDSYFPPTIIIEVIAQEHTKQSLRSPRFVRIRPDKQPNEVSLV